MSYIKSVSLKNNKKKIVAATAICNLTGNKLLFILNKHNGIFYSVGYRSEYEDYEDIVLYHREVTPIHKGDKVTLEF